MNQSRYILKSCLHLNLIERETSLWARLVCQSWFPKKAGLFTLAQSEYLLVRLNLETKEVKVEEWENKLDTPFINTFDFPIINPDFTGVKHRYKKK